MTAWQSLFERAEDGDVTVEDVRNALADRRNE